MADKKFIDGLSYKYPREGAPEYVKGSLSIKVDEFSEWFAQWQVANPDAAWINIDLMEGRSGKPYACLNEYKKLGSSKPEQKDGWKPGDDYPNVDDINPDDIPF